GERRGGRGRRPARRVADGDLPHPEPAGQPLGRLKAVRADRPPGGPHDRRGLWTRSMRTRDTAAANRPTTEPTTPTQSTTRATVAQPSERSNGKTCSSR